VTGDSPPLCQGGATRTAQSTRRSLRFSVSMATEPCLASSYSSRCRGSWWLSTSSAGVPRITCFRYPYGARQICEKIV
jgi:hypothetical protein